MNVNFSRKEIIKFILKVYLPLLIILNFTVYIVHGKTQGDFFEKDFKSIIMLLITPVFFSYPMHLLVNFKIKKIICWFFIGIAPFMLILISITKEIPNISMIISLIIFSNIMYPLGLLGVKTFKDYWEMSKEMTLFGKIGLFLSLLFIIISIIKRLRW